MANKPRTLRCKGLVKHSVIGGFSTMLGGNMLLIVLLGFTIRMLIALHGLHGTDILYHLAGAFTVLKGGLLYRDVHYVYPPLYAYLQAGVIALLGRNIVAYKFWPILSDILIAILLYLFLESNEGKNLRLIIASIYLFNPLTLISSSWYGLFDSLLAFLILCSLYLYIKGRKYLSSITLGVGVVTKIASLFLMPLMATHVYLREKIRKTILWLLIFATPVFLVEFPYLVMVGKEAIKQQLKFHIARGGEGFSLVILFGETSANPLFPLALWFLRILIYAIVVYLLTLNTKVGKNVIIEYSMLILLSLITFNTFLYPHYIIYVLPLVLITYSKALQKLLTPKIKGLNALDAEVILPALFLIVTSIVCPMYWIFYRNYLIVSLIAVTYNTVAITFLTYSIRRELRKTIVYKRS